VNPQFSTGRDEIQFVRNHCRHPILRSIYAVHDDYIHAAFTSVLTTLRDLCHTFQHTAAIKTHDPEHGGLVNVHQLEDNESGRFINIRPFAI
jgi:hypothetical protein